MDTPLTVRVVGDAQNRREVVSYTKAMSLYAIAFPSISPSLPAFLGAFTYPTALQDHVNSHGGSTAGYAGPVGVPALHFDIDRTNFNLAIEDARRLVQYLADRYGIDPLIHYSGSKGFHITVSTGSFITPSTDNHRVARALACHLAGEAGIAVDAGVYGRLQLWRAPNSKHGRSGYHKVKIEPEDLLRLDADRIRRLASGPVPYDWPVSASATSRLMADWAEAVHQVHTEQLQQARRETAGGEVRDRINPLSRTLITDPTSIKVGERHRTIFSAAANMAEFLIDDLIFAVLTEPALDTGLSVAEVRRQIRCGIDHAHHQRPTEGGVAPCPT
jgi:hypothetical protein